MDSTDTPAALAALEKIEELISDECLEYLYYPQSDIQIIFQKIRNAAQNLLYDAARLCRGQPVLFPANSKPLPVSEVLLLLKKMLFEITSLKTPQEIESKLFGVIKAYNLKPEEIMQPNPTVDEQYFENAAKLNG